MKAYLLRRRDWLVGEALLPVGEHECVTCRRCACTFAVVHPACPRCSTEERAAQQLEQADSLAEANKRLNEWYGTAKREAERYREALARARQDITELHGAGFDSARREVANQACARIDAALTPDEGAERETMGCGCVVGTHGSSLSEIAPHHTDNPWDIQRRMKQLEKVRDERADPPEEEG